MLLLAALNPRPSVSLRLLTSRSPALPLGVWLAAGGGAGALLSGLATVLALREGGRRWRPAPDRIRQPSEPTWFRPTWPAEDSDSEPEPDASRQAETDDWLQAGPPRGPGEPPPTVSVPFRVLRRPRRGAPAASDAKAATTTASPARSGAAGPGEQPAGDGWDSTEEEDW